MICWSSWAQLVWMSVLEHMGWLIALVIVSGEAFASKFLEA